MNDPFVVGFTGHRDRLAAESTILAIEQRFPGAVWVHGGAGGFDTQVNAIAKMLGKVLGETLIVIGTSGIPLPLGMGRDRRQAYSLGHCSKSNKLPLDKCSL